jgi:hypothetical protein
MSSAYKDAVEFLIRRIPSDEPRAVLQSYLTPPNAKRTPVPLSEVFRRILSSAQNANMKAGVIGGSIGGFNNLGRALFKFDPKLTQHKFGGDPTALLKHIQKTLKPRGKMRTSPRSIWPKYCRTVLSAAVFLSQFKDGKDFLAWAEHLYSDDRTIAALPLILDAEIEGVGYALACDFLKEFGFTNYGKPDVHVNRLLAGLGLAPVTPSPYQAQRIIAQVAKAEKVPPYDVDKVLWLIGSGKLYKHKHLGKNGQIGRMTKQFLAERHGA